MPQPFTAAAMPQELQLPLNALSSVSSRALPLHSHCTPTALTALPYTPTCSCSPSPFSLPGRLKMAATSARPQLLQPRGSVGRTEPSRNKALTKHSARIAHTALIPPSPSVGTHPCRTQPSVHRCAACRHFGSYLCLEGCSSAPPSLPFPSRALSEPRSSRPPPGLPPPSPHSPHAAGQPAGQALERAWPQDAEQEELLPLGCTARVGRRSCGQLRTQGREHSSTARRVAAPAVPPRPLGEETSAQHCRPSDTAWDLTPHGSPQFTAGNPTQQPARVPLRRTAPSRAHPRDHSTEG